MVSEIPYQVNKANLMIKIAELVNAEKIKGVSAVRDESDRNGLRIVIEVKRDALANVVLSTLYKYTPLQSSYGVNNIALVNGRPRMLNLKDIISEFIKFRIEVIVRRTKFELRKAEERAHILDGLLIALDNLDAIIKIIRGSKTVEEARNNLISSFDLSDKQVKAILEMRLQKLVSLEIEKVKNEYDELQIKIAHYEEILKSERMQRDIIKEELAELKEKYGDERRTEIRYADGEISIEDMIPNEEVVITISHLGYIKRTKSDEYRVQNRGGKGSRGSKTRTEDYIEHIFVANNHNYLLLFTEQGRIFWLRVYEIPEASKISTGRVIQNIISIPKDDKVKAYIKIEDLKDEEFINSHYLVFATKKGLIKKTLVENFSRPRSNGIKAITIRESDQLLEVKLTNGSNEVLIANKFGRAIRFNESKVRSMGRGAAGVIGMRINKKEDEIIGMVCVDPLDDGVTILVVSENGIGKRTDIDQYRITNRGGKGVKTMKLTKKTGNVIAIKSVTNEDELMITTHSGIVIRMLVSDMRVIGRATQGVKLIRLNEGEQIADVAKITKSASNSDEEE